MALAKGSVSINALTGVTISSTGLAGRIFDSLEAKTDLLGVTDLALAAAKQQIADLAETVSDSVIDEMVDNAEVKTAVVTEVAFPIPVTVALPAGVGGTTATGAGTGEGVGKAGSAIF